MPQVIIKGLKSEEVKAMSENILEALSNINETPKDYYLFQHDDRPYYVEGTASNAYPLVEIIQFKRDSSQEAQTAQYLINYIKGLGYDEAEVYYIHLERSNYYMG